MRTVRLIGIAVGVAVFALLAQLSLLTYGVYALILSLIASELLAYYSLDRIQCVRDVAVDRANIGEEITVSTIIHNNKPIPVPWMLAEESLPRRLPVRGDHTRLLVLRPYGDARLRYTITMAHRGYHQIGPAVMESGDLFGFVRRFRAGRRAHYITVQPETVPILKYDIATRRPIGEVKIRRMLHEDPTRMAGVREYQRGDALNRIHWRATARTGALHSKTYEYTTLAGALLCVDFHGPSYGDDDDRRFERSELVIKAAASIGVYLAELSQEVGLLSNGLDAAERAKREEGAAQAHSRREARSIAEERTGADRLRPVLVPARKGNEQAMVLLDALARLELSDGRTLDRMLVEEQTRLPRDLTLMLVVPCFTPELYQVLARLRFSGFTIAALLVDNPEQAEEARIRLAAERIELHHIRQPADLQELAERRLG